MSGIDLLVDGFPHGTPAGYEKGCRGKWCPAATETGQSCAQASVRFRGDHAYRKAVLAGASVEVLRVPEQFAPERRMKVQPAPTALREPKPVEAPALAPVAVKARRKSPSKEIEHGTVNGYGRGCRSEISCPKGPDGVSCNEASRADQRARRQQGRAAGPRRSSHGTLRGYQLGCKGDDCPRGADGRSCGEVGRAYWAEQRRVKRSRIRGAQLAKRGQAVTDLEKLDELLEDAEQWAVVLRARRQELTA